MDGGGRGAQCAGRFSAEVLPGLQPDHDPPPPNLIIDSAQFSDAAVGGGNTDHFIDPGEIIFETVVLQNTDGLTATHITATLSADTPEVTLIQPASVYPDLPPGELAPNAPLFAYRVSKSIACGSTIAFTHVSFANGLSFTNHFKRTVGHPVVIAVTTNLFESSDVPAPIPDGGSIISANTITNQGTLVGLAVSLRLDHEWVGDLQIDLEHPDGTRVALVNPNGNGGQDFGTGNCDTAETRTRFVDNAASSLSAGVAPFVGAFRPATTLSNLYGKPIEGEWRLRVADTSIEDTGTLYCWAMTATVQQTGQGCTVFNQPPFALNQDVAVVHDSPIAFALAGVTAEDSVAAFQIQDPPGHGTLSSFDTTTGVVTYSPEPGYSGPDSFRYEISDGTTNRATATVHLSVQSPTADLSILGLPRPIFSSWDRT